MKDVDPKVFIFGGAIVAIAGYFLIHPYMPDVGPLENAMIGRVPMGTSNCPIDTSWSSQPSSSVAGTTGSTVPKFDFALASIKKRRRAICAEPALAAIGMHVYILAMLYIELAIVIVLILVNGLLALAELAIVSSRRARLRALVDSRGHWRAPRPRTRK